MLQKNNDGKHIVDIIVTTACSKHMVAQDEPCWTVHQDANGRRSFAVCGSRIRSAGFIGKISATATQVKPARGPVPNRKR